MVTAISKSPSRPVDVGKATSPTLFRIRASSPLVSRLSDVLPFTRLRSPWKLVASVSWSLSAPTGPSN
jgi:hypothetical protein